MMGRGLRCDTREIRTLGTMNVLTLYIDLLPASRMSFLPKIAVMLLALVRPYSSTTQ